ncbi:MAG: ABC transporter permease [Tenericutes bacterium]|nr:ABC transporter permease [Mycoplasmatota bacterium]
MKTKFKYLTKESIKKKINTKWFKAVNIILLILIPCLANLDSLIKFFGGDFSNETKIHIIDEVGVYDELSATIDGSYMSLLESYNLSINKSEKALEELKKEIKEEKSPDIILEIIPSENIFDVQIISYDYIDTVLYQTITTALDTTRSTIALSESGIDLEILNKVYQNTDISRIILNENLNEDEELMLLVGSVLIIIFIVPFFFLIIMIVQMIGAEINEEKTSKSMEIIISSVSPEVHFASKLVSANAFALLQGALLIVYLIIGILTRLFFSSGSGLGLNSLGQAMNISEYINAFLSSDIMINVLYGLPFFIILMILSFMAYSLFIGVLASMTTSMEDYQQIQTPVMLFLMVGYYLAIIASVYEGAIFIKIAAYVPLISGILAPVLYTIGQFTIIDLIIAIILLLALCAALYKYGLKIYKVGILNYSSSKLWKKIFKSLKD